MTHLSAGDLRRWFDEGRAEDRERVVSHLAACAECRRALAAMAVDAPTAATPPIVDAADVVERGYAARPKTGVGPVFPATTVGKTGPTPSSWWRGAGAWRPALALAAVAVVAVTAVVVLRQPAAPPADTVEIRGSDLQAIGPAGTVSGSWEFRWASPFEADRYRVTVRDATGAVVRTEETRASALAPTPALLTRLRAGADYTWEVEALDREGERIATAPPTSFRVVP